MAASKESAKQIIHATLTSVKQFLAQELPPKLSEADTKANFIEPLLSALGWTGIGVVVREYYVKNSQEFIDYVMKDQGGAILAFEAKAVQADLTEKAGAQLVQYCVVEGIEWAALTNGRELRFFNTYLRGDLAAKLILRLDLLAFNSDAEYDALFEQLWLLSQESMNTPTGVRTWLEHRRMDQALRGTLLNAASPVIKALRRYLAEGEIKASHEEIVQWFRAELAPPITTLPLQPDRASNALPPLAKHPTSITMVEPRSPQPTRKEQGKAKRTSGPSRGASNQPSPDAPLYLLTPVRDEKEEGAQEIIQRLLSQGWYVFGDRTPGRKGLKPGDHLCFYHTGFGVVAEAVVASQPEQRTVPGLRRPQKYPWAFRVSNARYFFDQPVALDRELRTRLDAFAGRDPARPWAWFVQGTHKVTEHDFRILTGRTASEAASA